jgi:gluconolactonase
MRRVLSAIVAGLLVMVAGCARAADAPERIATDLGFPEGVIFVGPTLYFVDYAQSDVLRLVGGAVQRVAHLEGCGANGLVESGGTLLVACFENGTVLQVALDGRILATIGQDSSGQPFIAPNDLAVDAKGGVYLAASGTDRDLGKVFYRAADGRVTAVAEGIRFANGIGLSPDGKLLYVVETRANRVLRFAIAPDGSLTGRQVLVALGDILHHAGIATYTADGLRVDAAGRLFVALYNGGGVAVIDANGALLREIGVPEPHHTSLAITPDGRSMVVTAVRDGADGAYHAALYRVGNPMTE